MIFFPVEREERKRLFKEMCDTNLNCPRTSHGRSSSASEFRESEFQGKEHKRFIFNFLFPTYISKIPFANT